MSGGPPMSLRARVAARSLLLQSCWNDQGMQNVGFAFALAPWLKRIERSGGPSAAEGVRRHLQFFNTQPYMASFVLGVSGRLEEELAAQPPESRPAAEARIQRLKAGFGSALAGVGDSLFWGALRPFCAALGLFTWLTAWSMGSRHPAAWAAAAYLAAHNLPALWLRWSGVGLGYALGEGLAGELRNFRWHERIRALRWAGLALAALVSAAALLVPPWSPAASWTNVAVLALAVGIRSFGWSTPRVYAASTALCLAWAWARP